MAEVVVLGCVSTVKRVGDKRETEKTKGGRSRPLSKGEKDFRRVARTLNWDLQIAP